MLKIIILCQCACYINNEIKYFLETHDNDLTKVVPVVLSGNPDSGDEIVMQGAVDLAFEENGKLVIVDYKTDRVREIGKLAVLYRKQLLLYKEALRRSMEQEVGECLICSLALNDVISVE